MQEHGAKLASESVQLIRGALREIVTTIVPAVLLALFVNVFVAEAAQVEEGPSMQQLRVAAGA